MNERLERNFGRAFDPGIVNLPFFPAWEAGRKCDTNWKGRLS
jgi:hypothetical protein